ncbi:SAM-dependent methyltransferase [Sphaerisporangium viridialbum]|uniref:SAM-dependent methyltransferase n=1 Tax=Sphaerisporangium viridialbum TaxID=46189 RepID=UPI003C789792
MSDSSGGGAGRSPVPLRSAVDTGTPRVARIYNCLLGDDGDSFASEREAAARILAMNPRVRHMVLANRQFLGRAVRHAVATRGIHQLLDIGSGYPTQHNVHEVAHSIAPDACTVYVDNDEVVASHGRALLADDRRSFFVECDLRQPGEIIWAAQTVLDFTKPVAVLLVAILHFLPDGEDPHGIVKDLVGALAPGSLLVVSHVLDDAQTQRGARVYDRASAPVVPRSPDRIGAFFDGLDLEVPGLVTLPMWQPDDDTWYQDEADSMPVLCAVGRKP